MEAKVKIVISLPHRLDGLLMIDLLLLDGEAVLQVDYPAMEYSACETLSSTPRVFWEVLHQNLIESWSPKFRDCQPPLSGIDDSSVIPLVYWHCDGLEQLMGEGASPALLDLLETILTSCKQLPQQELLELALAGLSPDHGLRYLEHERTWRWFGSSYGVQERHILAWAGNNIGQPAILDASNLLCRGIEQPLLAVIQDSLFIRSWKVPRPFLEPLQSLGVSDEHIYLYDRSHAWYNEETGCTAISRRRHFRIWDALLDSNVKTTTR